MKLKNVLLTLGLATTVAAGAMAFGLNSALKQAYETQAGAGSAANTMTIFIGANGEAKCSINGGNDAANVGIYLFTERSENDKDELFLDAQRIGDNYFSAAIPTTYEKMVLVRTNPNKSFVSDNWAAKYNQTANIDFSSSNVSYTLTGIGYDGTLTYSASSEFNTSKTNYINEGTRYYFDAYNLRSWWHNDSDTYHTYIKTYTDYDGWYGAWGLWFEMTRIPNIDIYYVDIPYGVCANGFDIVRNNNESYTNCDQTWSITGLTDLSYIAVGDKSDGKYSYGYSVCNNDEMLYSTYRSFFLAMDLCYDAGGLKDSAAELWAKAEETYDVMYGLLISKGYIKNATADFIERYDAVVSKNAGYNDFMERGISYVSPNGMVSSIMMGSDSNASIMIIVIASSVALLFAASFFMIGKRKEQ